MARLLTLLLTAAAAACLLTVTRAEENLGCIDPDGKPVDWYVIYKLPKNVVYTYFDGTERTRRETKGDEYLFLSPSYSDQLWRWKTYLGDLKKSKDDPTGKLRDRESALGQTMKPCYGNDKRYDVFYAFSDSPRPKYQASSSYGHSKQVLAKRTAITEGRRGFWLFHTLPWFPKADGYSFESNIFTNAQTFLCMTMTSDEDWRDATAYITAINAYRYIPTTVQEKRNNGYDYLQESKAENFFSSYDSDLLTPTTRMTPAATPNPFCPEQYWQSSVINSPKIIAKTYTKTTYTDEGVCDLYKAVAWNLGLNFSARSWKVPPKPEHTLDSNWTVSSTGYVKDIEYIRFGRDILSSDIEMTEFRSSKDHSKWAISNVKEMCFGDLNHELKNMKRPGGFVCSTNLLLFDAFDKITRRYGDPQLLLYSDPE